MTQTAIPIKCFPFSNGEVAAVLEQVADLLESQAADYYRIRAYREAAQTIRGWTKPVAEVLQAEGTPGLEKLPRIGRRLAAALEELLHTGELSLHQQLLAECSPEERFVTVPGIGKVLARRIYQTLGITTLEALELAAHTGQLDDIRGLGKGRIQLIRDALATILNRSSHQHAQLSRWQDQDLQDVAQPSAALLLQIDAQYRELAAANRLPKITPRRFNPGNKRWLPILHAQQGGWQFSALYSNTARAHELKKTQDWVVIYYERKGREGQCTVVTETRGGRKGDRVIRGQAVQPQRADLFTQAASA